MKNLIAAALMTLTMGVAALAEPVEKAPTAQPSPAPIVTTAAPAPQPQPEVKKEQAPAQPAPVKEKKPVELNFRSF